MFSCQGVIFRRLKDGWVAVSCTSKKIAFADLESLQNQFEIVNILSPRYGPLLKKYQGLCLYLTNQCNLDCVYCYAFKGFRPKGMSWDVAQTAIDFYLGNKPEIAKIVFHAAGEPTLEFDLIKRCVEYVEANVLKQSKIIFSIVTNGSFSEKILKYLCDKNFSISISFDGCPNVQDKQRPLRNGCPSSFFVARTIKYLKRKKMYFKVNATFTKQTYQFMKRSVRYLHGLGVEHLNLNPVFLCDKCKGNSIEEVDITAYLRYFSEAKEEIKKLGNIKLATRGYELPFPHRCWTTTAHYLGISYDGFVTGCTLVTDRKDPVYDLFHFGEVDIKSHSVKLNHDLIEKYRARSFDDIPKCKDCLIQEYCNGGCMMRCLLSNGDLNIPDEEECKRLRTIFTDYIDEIIMETLQQLEKGVLRAKKIKFANGIVNVAELMFPKYYFAPESLT